jgi:hypothetical protein
MVAAEFRKLVARRGLFLSSLLIPAGVVILLVVLSVILEASTDDYEGGVSFVEGAAGLNVFVLLVLSALIGATAGAWDVQNGTFRYMLMTGRSRLAVYAVRVPAVLALIVVITVPAWVVTVAGGEALPLGLGEEPTLRDHAWALWAPVLQGWVYGLVAFGVGALLRSVGAAIAVALVLNLAGLQALLLLSLVSDTLGDITLPAVANRVSGFSDEGLPLVAAVLVLVAWVGVVLGAAGAHRPRAEY